MVFGRGVLPERTVSPPVNVVDVCCCSDADHLETPPAPRSVVSRSDALAHVFGLRRPLAVLTVMCRVRVSVDVESDSDG